MKPWGKSILMKRGNREKQFKKKVSSKSVNEKVMKIWKISLYFLWRSSNWQCCFKVAEGVVQLSICFVHKISYFFPLSLKVQLVSLAQDISWENVFDTTCGVHKKTSSIFRDNRENMIFFCAKQMASYITCTPPATLKQHCHFEDRHRK